MPIDPITASSLFTSASLIVAFFGGMVMLFAPCCITLMLPAYLGSVFKAKSKVLFMTLVFAAGVATIMLPLVLGARFLASFFNQYHFFVFAAGSLLMISVGFMSLFNKAIELPFVSRLKAPQITNASTAYSLGVVSGVSSSCCAPVLLGALSLAALSPSLLQAAGVGLSYTFGIVFPLFLLGLFFEKGYWKWGMKLQQKTLRFGALTVTLANFLSFLIFTTTGFVFLVLTMLDKTQMGESAIGFGIAVKSWVQATSEPVRSIPYGEYVFGAILLGLFVFFIRRALARGKGNLDKGAHDGDSELL